MLASSLDYLIMSQANHAQTDRQTGRQADTDTHTHTHKQDIRQSNHDQNTEATLKMYNLGIIRIPEEGKRGETIRKKY